LICYNSFSSFYQNNICETSKPVQAESDNDNSSSSEENYFLNNHTPMRIENFGSSSLLDAANDLSVYGDDNCFNFDFRNEVFIHL